jgi:hypothetical protein
MWGLFELDERGRSSLHQPKRPEKKLCSSSESGYLHFRIPRPRTEQVQPDPVPEFISRYHEGKAGVNAARIAVAILSLTASASAFASGDPGVLWWVLFLLCWYIAAAVAVAFTRTPRMWRTAGIALYVVAAVPAWIWYLNVPGPEMLIEHVVMTASPVVLVLPFMVLSRIHGRRTGEFGRIPPLPEE